VQTAYDPALDEVDVCFEEPTSEDPLLNVAVEPDIVACFASGDRPRLVSLRISQPFMGRSPRFVDRLTSLVGASTVAGLRRASDLGEYLVEDFDLTAEELAELAPGWRELMTTAGLAAAPARTAVRRWPVEVVLRPVLARDATEAAEVEPVQWVARLALPDELVALGLHRQALLRRDPERVVLLLMITPGGTPPELTADLDDAGAVLLTPREDSTLEAEWLCASATDEVTVVITAL
jgi:hypothetical protein